ALERELVRHALTEAVDGEDRRLVELVERRLDARAVGARVRNTLAALDQGAQVGLVARRRWIGERRGGAPEVVADATAQLGGRGDGERDDENLADPALGFEHRAQHEGRDRERLARAGARLDELHALERYLQRLQRPHDV